MATVDVRLSNAQFFDTERFDLKLGEKATVRLKRTEDDYEGPIDWAHTGDPVLKIVKSEDPSADEAEISADSPGESFVFIIQKKLPEFIIISQLHIVVRENITEWASSLGATGEPVDKDL